MRYRFRRADVAQLVEHRLPKPKVAGSRPVVRFSPQSRSFSGRTARSAERCGGLDGHLVAERDVQAGRKKLDVFRLRFGHENRD